MLTSQGQVTRLHVADRATEPPRLKESHLPTATHKDFLGVQIVNRLIHIQGKISDNYRGFLGSSKFNQKKEKEFPMTNNIEIYQFTHGKLERGLVCAKFARATIVTLEAPND